MNDVIPPPPPYVPPLYEDPTPNGVDVVTALPGYDPAFEIVHFDEWADFEEHGWMAILRKDGQLYEISGGYCVMASGPQDDVFDPFPIAENRALELIAEWERIERTDFSGC